MEKLETEFGPFTRNEESGQTAEEVYKDYLDYIKTNKIDICCIKQDKIKESKEKLAKWLEENPLYSTIHNKDGELYSVIESKQSQLTMTILLEQLALSKENTSNPTWNATGKECESWTLEELIGLSFQIKEYVKPRVAKQQSYEVQINECQTIEEINKIEMEYDTI